MHPFFSRPERLFVYLAGWLGLALLASFALSVPDGNLLDTAFVVVPVTLLYSFVSLSSWYVCRSLPLQNTPPVRLGVSILASSVIGGALLYGLTLGMSAIISGSSTPRDLSGGGALIVFLTGLVLYLLTAVFHYLLITFEISRGAERRSLEAEVLARSSELKALRAQIDPHFLFNSLNSISALIASDQERARSMTILLADFFRASVSAGRRQSIPLAEEISLIRTYLEIERVRHGDRLQLSVTVEDDAGLSLVPPLVLQPLVENAIKHGIATLIGGGEIRITAAGEGGKIRVSITNPVDSASSSRKPEGASFGLQAVRDRVRALTGTEGSLDTSVSGDVFTATVTLPRRTQ